MAAKVNNPLITIDRIKPEGNCFCIMNTVTDTLTKYGREDLIDEYYDKATESHYEHLCEVSTEYVNIKFIN